MTAPLKFKGNRKFDEIKAEVLRRGGEWAQVLYDQGDDHVTFKVQLGQRKCRRTVIYNTFNGKFIVKVANRYVTETSTDYDHVGWYRDLLNMLYLPLEEKSDKEHS